jgi:hypothetical protein
MLLQDLHKPFAVNETLRLCLTLSISERPQKLGIRVVRIHQITLSKARSDAAVRLFRLSCWRLSAVLLCKSRIDLTVCPPA